MAAGGTERQKAVKDSLRLWVVIKAQHFAAMKQRQGSEVVTGVPFTALHTKHTLPTHT